MTTEDLQTIRDMKTRLEEMIGERLSQKDAVIIKTMLLTQATKDPSIHNEEAFVEKLMKDYVPIVYKVLKEKK